MQKNILMQWIRRRRGMNIQKTNFAQTFQVIDMQIKDVNLKI